TTVRSLRKFIALPAVLALAASLAAPLSAQEDRWNELNARFLQLYRQGGYAEAVPVAQEALRVAEATFGPEHSRTATSLNNLAALYAAQGRYAEAEPLYNRALAIKEKALGPDHRDVAMAMNNLAELYGKLGRFADAEALHRRALAVREKTLGANHPDVAQSLNNLAGLYLEVGRYAEAEPLCKRALIIREKTLGAGHPSFAASLNMLAELYFAQGNYAGAEPLYNAALDVAENALGPEHPNVAVALNNLAQLYRAQGKYAEAEPLYLRALLIDKESFGAEHPDFAAALTNLAALYYDEGKYAEAEPFFRRALAIDEAALGADHPDLASDLNNLAALYQAQGKYAEAGTLLQRSLAILQSALGPEHPNVASTISNLAAAYRAQGKYAEAEPLYKRALAIDEKALGTGHPYTGTVLNHLAGLYYAWGKPDEAENFFERGRQNLAAQFERHFAYMSEKERLEFRDAVARFFPAYFSFCLAYRERVPRLTAGMYNTLLWEKGFIAASMAAMWTKIAAAGDPEAVLLLRELAAKRTESSNIAGILARQPAQSQELVQRKARLDEQTNEIERQLVRRSAALAEDKKVAQATWGDVQRALGKDEAAVEFVRFPFHDGKNWSGKNFYAALVLTQETAGGPALVLLGEAENLEGEPFRDYREWVRPAGGWRQSSTAAGAKFYDAFWKPLEAALGPARRVYLSLDGELSQVSWPVIPDHDGRLLMETFDLRPVLSTKDVLRAKRTAKNNTAALIGNPAFDLSESEQHAAVARLPRREGTAPASVVAGTRSRERGTSVGPLPGTQVEVDAVRGLLEEKGWRVERYTQDAALEETVKRVQGPRLLHIATHGFFEADQQAKRRAFSDDQPLGLEDPMLRSGLLFAGANRTLGASISSPAPDLDDGVLTAYEATGLNLQNTELVVLSACQTGLGEVKSGEGVFGLQRAMQEAGAEAVLMSLWSVPDEDTQQLMKLFYSYWLAGADKHEALRRAQLDL
ncbi:MAG TPA: CHAT domain-containing tetratricopeptide repeat protein, partial [Methylomirabilota bacterium]|nr:CHAT domain-containing tetratricopeptide repeat protein [Methylomirabilota bacterium]